MVDLPKLDLTCLKNPSGNCVLVAESCVNCRNNDIILEHAAAHQKEMVEFNESSSNSTKRKFANAFSSLAYDARIERDAVMKLLPKEAKLKEVK